MGLIGHSLFRICYFICRHSLGVTGCYRVLTCLPNQVTVRDRNESDGEWTSAEQTARCQRKHIEELVAILRVPIAC